MNEVMLVVQIPLKQGWPLEVRHDVHEQQRRVCRLREPCGRGEIVGSVLAEVHGRENDAAIRQRAVTRSRFERGNHQHRNVCSSQHRFGD